MGLELKFLYKGFGVNHNVFLSNFCRCLYTFCSIAGNVEKSRQRRSRQFAVLTYSLYAPRVKLAAALLDGLF
jgi:hypothetical protein